MERVRKMWYLPARPGRRTQAKVGRKTQEKVVRKEKTMATRTAAKQKEWSKVTFTDVERLFMKLVKGANEEDCKFLTNFERDDFTRIYDHKIRSVYNVEFLSWTWRDILTRSDRARKCLDELCWKIEWKHNFLEKVCETLPFRVPYKRTAVFNQFPCPSLRGWLHRLKSAVLSVLQEDRSRGTSSTANVNTFPMTRNHDLASFVTARPGICRFPRWFQGLMRSRTSLICGSLG